MSVHSHAPRGQAWQDPAAGSGEHGTHLPPIGYPSPVCSIDGDAIDRITAAIDQLANDTQEAGSNSELTSRVADLWRMVSELDPELARRTRRYTTPTDDAPSA
jgi:hypothetical protein